MKRRILAVEDEEKLRRVLELQLASAGFDVEKARTAEEALKIALHPGGRAAALEFVPNEDRVSPPMAAEFSLTMLANTAGGDAYTFREDGPRATCVPAGRVYAIYPQRKAARSHHSCR